MQHRRECLEDDPHLRWLVGKQGGRIHIVHDRGVVSLEYQQLSAFVFRAVDREIVKADAIGHVSQRGPMPTRKTDVERAHEHLFFETLRCVF